MRSHVGNPVAEQGFRFIILTNFEYCSQPKRGKKPLRTEWCLDTETAAAADPIAQYSRNGNQF